MKYGIKDNVHIFKNAVSPEGKVRKVRIFGHITRILENKYEVKTQQDGYFIVSENDIVS